MRLMALIMPVSMLVLNFGIVAVLWFGGKGTSIGANTLGEMMAVSNYLLRTLFSVIMFGTLLVRIARAGASVRRVNEVLTEEPEITVPETPRQPETVAGRVTFESVSFAYDGEPVLTDISYDIAPGEIVAILGTTGSGKSTFVQLIPRFYDVTGGRILLDGIDVREMDPAFLRRQVVVSLQDTILFSGTIADNIRYGRAEATDEEIGEAALTAQVEEFASRLPDKYESVVGQRGVGLSGGQKQRVAIARALVARPAVLVLDDCTSSVDVQTEARIHDRLKSGRRTTTIIVAQRISTILSADRILLLNDGRLEAQGSHTTLLETSPVYREIFESQLGAGGQADG
jgi:ATP-binding cassette subfamily B protein